jgi:putative ABC transport system permease protein
MRENVTIMTTVYVTLSVIIAFGVIYNSARIQLSERARELATLRVLGFTRAEVSRVLLTELGVIVAAAQPLGWLLGYLLALAVIAGFESDLFRVPLVVSRATFVTASLIVIVAAMISALVVRRRIDRLDLVRVLKTRE